jgi:outer membrane murein-binding lipoprotein Lpp
MNKTKGLFLVTVLAVLVASIFLTGCAEEQAAGKAVEVKLVAETEEDLNKKLHAAEEDKALVGQAMGEDTRVAPMVSVTRGFISSGEDDEDGEGCECDYICDSHGICDFDCSSCE